MDDDGVFTLRFIADDLGLGPHVDATAPGAIGLHNPCTAIDLGAGGKIGAGDVLHQLIHIDVRVLQGRQTTRDHLTQVVGRNVGGHTHGDARRSVDQQIGDPGRQHRRYLLGAIVVVDEIDRFLVEISEQGMRNFRHANFGVAHGGSRVAVDRSKVALPVYQGVAQREILSHSHDGVIHRRITVRVILTNYIADHACGLFVGLVPVVIQLVHRKQHSAMHWLQTVSDIRQGATDDHAHGVVHVRLFQLIFDVDGEDFPRHFLGIFCHAGYLTRPRNWAVRGPDT